MKDLIPIREKSKGECMQRYNNHPIYGIGILRSEKKWNCRGLIFDPDDQVTEIKRLECADLTFATKRKAEEHALELCKNWINEQSGAQTRPVTPKAVAL
jgi:hypothetical protein